MAKMFLAAVVMAVLAVASQAESVPRGWEEAELPVAQRQRALLTTAGGAAYYSPTYSPSPAYSPSPVMRPYGSPKPSPTKSPKASPAKSPKSPKVCKFAKTKNANTYKIVVRAKGKWGLGAKALKDAAARVYKKYSQSKLKIKVTGPKKQNPKQPYQSFVYFVVVPVTPCAGFKEGMRASLAKALKKLRYSRSVKVVTFKKIN